MNGEEIDAKLRKKLKRDPTPWHHIKDAWFPGEEAADVMDGLRRLIAAGEAVIDYGFGWRKALSKDKDVEETLDLLHPNPWKQRPLTPYDKGTVLEPFLWTDVDNEESDYGKVDFDHPDGITHFTAWAEPDEEGVVLHINTFGANVRIKWEGE